jgi:Protein of unknown function (DUF3301)
MSWDLLLLSLALVALGLAWHANLAARELANRVATDTCNRASVQLLDGTVCFLNAKPMRGRDGWLTLRRTYVFDYTEDGHERRRGFVVIAGTSVETVGLGPRAVT